MLKCFFLVTSSFQESFLDTRFRIFKFSMTNLCSFVDTQNLNDFLSSIQVVSLNDNQLEINDVFLNTVSNDIFQCKYFDMHSQCFRIPENQLFLLHVNTRS